MTAATDSLYTSGRHLEGCLINAPRRPEDRRIHFLDLDNLHSTGCPSIERTKRVYAQYQDLVVAQTDVGFGAAQLLGSGSVATLGLKDLWSRWPVRLARGRNGADKALIADIDYALPKHQLGHRFRDVVIGSGDKIFASSVRRLRKEGRTVHLVIAHPSNLGPELELTANGCIWLLPTGECLRHRAIAGAHGLAA